MHLGFLALDYPTTGSGGGVGSQIRVLAKTLVKAGHRASVVALSRHGDLSMTQDEGVNIYRVSPGNIHWYVSRFPGMNKLVVTAIREVEYSKAVWSAVCAIQRNEPFDLLEGTETGSLFAALDSRGVPLVIRLHGDEFTFHKHTPDLKLTPALRLTRVIQRIALRRSRLLISPSMSHLHEISSELHGEHPPIEVVPNSVANIAAAPESCAVASDLGGLLESDAPLVLYTGRIEKRKGVPLLLEAAAKVHQKVPDCHFVLAGAPHGTFPRSELNAIIDRLRLREFVHFVGHVQHENLAELYRRASITILPSYYETFGIAALESMNFGVPVVAVSAGSLPEVVIDGQTGILVPPGDVGALAEAIVRLVLNPDARRRLSDGALLHAKQFHADEHSARNLELYERSLDLHGNPEEEHIFFSPHPDDAVLSCGGFLDSLARKHRTVRVITVFATDAGNPCESAYARHLRAKWGISPERRLEDLDALRALGIDRVDQWNFVDAPWRSDDSGRPLYASYEALTGPIDTSDSATSEALESFIEIFLRDLPQSAALYFPLSIGGHVDHRHLFRIGARLRALGRRVRFYEDWPYAEAYERTLAPGWIARTVPIDIERKVDAIRKYKSQMPGLGGESDDLRRRINRFTRRVGVHGAAERFWVVSADARTGLPFRPVEAAPRLRDFKEFLRTLDWRGLESQLPVGQGRCLDVGCGGTRHRPVIESKGYQWIGVDLSANTSDSFPGDAQALPFASCTMAAVVAWQVMEYAPSQEQVMSEAARVLEDGGVFAGSVSFLEPLHGASLWGISSLGIQALLERHEFQDIQIIPGLSAFSLILWTWSRRCFGNWAGRFALPLTAAWLAPLAATRFLASWISYTLGFGTGHGMRWIAQRAPLEFAGQVVFVARKAARGKS